MLCTAIRVEPSSTKVFQVLGPADSLKLEPCDPQESTPVMVLLLKEWAYIVGDEPQIHAGEELVTGAVGSQLIVQFIPSDGSHPGTVRAILLSSSGRDPTAWIKHGNTTETFEEGQYVDAAFNSSGQFTGFTTPAAFDPNNPPSGSEGLWEMIEAEKEARGLP